MEMDAKQLKYEEEKAKGQVLYRAWHDACRAIAQHVEASGGFTEIGLTPDAVKSSKEYRLLLAARQLAWKRLRAFNAVFSKTYKSEIHADREKRIAEGDFSRYYDTRTLPRFKPSP